MKLFRVIAAMLFLSLAVSAGAAGRPEKVVYHISDASNAMQALGNIRNHLNASPNASIVVVTHGAGIDFLLEDARTRTAIPTTRWSRNSRTARSSSGYAITPSRGARSIASGCFRKRPWCRPVLRKWRDCSHRRGTPTSSLEARRLHGSGHCPVQDCVAGISVLPITLP